jgi:hydrogenase/urease accessory protein HupE
MDGFYVGLTHPLTEPGELLVLLALGLVLGQQRPESTPAAWPAFLGAVACGLVIAAITDALAAVRLALLAAAFGIGVLGAAAPSLAPLLVVAIAAGTGLVVGMASMPDPGPLGAILITIAGTLSGAALILFYASWGQARLRERFDRPWLAIGVRVLSSWIAAVSALMLALVATR